MIFIALSWFWMGISAYLWGMAFTSLPGGTNQYQEKNPDAVLLLGICMLTVYAEFFSLFHGVGALANLLLLISDTALLICFRKKVMDIFRKIFRTPRIWLITALLAMLFLLLLVLSKGIPYQYDTGLYHAQSIRWIETYGVVPGLGNLHNRLAYNSSFFCLQALFSLYFLVGQSLHGVNGFITFFFLGYAICSMKVFRTKKICLSDCFRLALLIFYSHEEANYQITVSAINSPGSDLMTLGLVLYIFTKWISHLEDGEQDPRPFAYLCILGVYAATLKLSAALVVLLTILPASQLIRQKKWKEISVYFFAGILVLLPFLIRNVLISGYLIYPYPELDLFQVDWKMPSYTLVYDRNEIKAWGWGLNDVMKFDSPFSVWFPVWYGKLDPFLRTFFLATLISAPIVFGIGFYRLLRHKDGKELLLAVTMAACFLLWFIGAPSPRYGMVYLLLFPAYAAGSLLCRLPVPVKPLSRNKLPRKTVPKNKVSWGWILARCTAVILILLCINPLLESAYAAGNDYLLHSGDYIVYPHDVYSLGDIPIYVPSRDDRSGYHFFPSTPYAARLNLIELRGDDLSDGFRMKAPYRNAYISTYGSVEANNVFSQE